MYKVLLFYFLLFIIPLLCALAFLIIGVQIGGNYFTDFEAFGGRGYEATGTLGMYIGLGIGLVIDLYLFVRRGKKLNTN